MTEDEISRGAKAIAQAGSPEFIHHAGATMEEMTRQMRTGKLEAVTATFSAHCALNPDDRPALLRCIPAMILQSYLHDFRALSIDDIERWRKQTPDWCDRLERAGENSGRLTNVAEAMAVEVQRLSV
jgi:hypothetical protein